jgi:hypothetical protein
MVGVALVVVGLAGSVLLARGGGGKQFYFSYLVALLYFLSIALGALFFVLIHFVSRAGWSTAVRRIAENAMGTLPLLALLSAPIYIGRSELFIWTHADVVAGDAVLRAKAPYLSEGFFLVRMVIYAVAWSGLAWYFASRSRAQDLSGDHAITRRLQMMAAPGIFVFALSITFAAVDWLMSLDPHWYSTIFGLYYFAGAVVAIHAFLIIVVTGLKNAGLVKGVFTADHFHDLGKLLHGFTVFWTYIAFSQFFLIWYANIPEETIWFNHRLVGSWKTATIALALGHFVIPFFLIMARTVKRSPSLLRLGAIWMLAMHYLDLHWLVMPNLHEHGFEPSLLDLTTWVAVGGAFLAAFGFLMNRSAVVAFRDPRLPESLTYENA